MSESAELPMNFGGIDDEGLSSFDRAKILIWPVSYEGTVSYGTGTGRGAMSIVDASRNMELYEEETDTEPYQVGIHTLPEFTPRETPAEMMDALYTEAKRLVSSDKFVCMIGGEGPCRKISRHQRSADRCTCRSPRHLRRHTAFACLDNGEGCQGYADPVGAGRHPVAFGG